MTVSSQAPGTTAVAAIAEPGGKYVEVVAGRDGPELLLGRRDAGAPHLRVPLRGLLTASAGRPWRVEPARPGGVAVTDGGTLVVTALAEALSARLELAFGTDGRLTLTTTWRNDSAEEVADVAAGLLIPLPAEDVHVTVPGVLYNDNPSSDPARTVPHIAGGLVVEEHRLPVPAVNAAWDGRYVSLFAHPEPDRSRGDGGVAYGSLGLLRSPGLTVTAMSGVIMFGGRPDVCYVSKAEIADREVGYRDLAPAATLTTRHTLDWGPVEPRGLGFTKLVRTGLYQDEAAGPLSADELVRLKANAMDARWNGDGYLAYDGVRHGRPRSYLYGWTGQCMKLARCDALLGLQEDRPERIERARRAADFYVAGSATPVRGLRAARYLVDDGGWEMFRRDGAGFVSSRALGETVADLAGLAADFRDAGLDVPPEWEEAVADAATLFWHARLPEGVVPLGWTPSGAAVSPMVTAAGIACVQAMLGAYRLGGERVWLLRAEEVLGHYHRLHAATFERPFAHATLDAAGEDKEAGMYYFLAAFELYRLTGEEMYARWARTAADWLLTFVYVWSPEYAAGTTFERRGFKACGWPSVSVQNHHLDVFFPTSELMEFGLATGEPWYAERAWTILHAMGQGVCAEPGDWGFEVPGEQGEGFFQTNWQRTGEANTWNPSWVIALPLYHALRMRRAA
ncbi:hypothetical protein AB0M50_31370 [Nonomuraea fuscirosea]|uniref:hypothetical protein n=1 Tax=Nonomuraea fuscirosea TaxID=1291556 RepID=UPI002DD99F54|nr:hypothetical protein [Nonomuraea fuscirosea]WSA48894.1 hypothetical protein OIE67_33030 [Nonomuraea fuscirosea]